MCLVLLWFCWSRRRSIFFSEFQTTWRLSYLGIDDTASRQYTRLYQEEIYSLVGYTPPGDSQSVLPWHRWYWSHPYTQLNQEEIYSPIGYTLPGDSESVLPWHRWYCILSIHSNIPGGDLFSSRLHTTWRFRIRPTLA